MTDWYPVCLDCGARLTDAPLTEHFVAIERLVDHCIEQEHDGTVMSVDEATQQLDGGDD
jgi:hypothetical protein